MEADFTPILDRMLGPIGGWLNLGFGALLVLLGVWLLWPLPGGRRSERRRLAASICLVLGLLALVGGWMQL